MSFLVSKEIKMVYRFLWYSVILFGIRGVFRNWHTLNAYHYVQGTGCYHVFQSHRQKLSQVGPRHSDSW